MSEETNINETATRNCRENKEVRKAGMGDKRKDIRKQIRKEESIQGKKGREIKKKKTENLWSGGIKEKNHRTEGRTGNQNKRNKSEKKNNATHGKKKNFFLNMMEVRLKRR